MHYSRLLRSILRCHIFVKLSVVRNSKIHARVIAIAAATTFGVILHFSLAAFSLQLILQPASAFEFRCLALSFVCLAFIKV